MYVGINNSINIRLLSFWLGMEVNNLETRLMLDNMKSELTNFKSALNNFKMEVRLEMLDNLKSELSNFKTEVCLEMQIESKVTRLV